MTKIKNLEDIKKKIIKVDLPKSFNISDSETITDVQKFVDVSLELLSADKLSRFHRPYFDRFAKLLTKLEIKIELDEK